MEVLIPLFAILGTFGIPLFWIKSRHETRRRQMELEHEQRRLPAGSSDEVQRVTEENRLLRERVENLESIVCSVDFELNQKVAKLIDEQRSMVLSPGSPGPMQIAAAQAEAKAGGAKGDAKPDALDRTATAHGVKPSLTTTLEPGQMLAQRYRVQRLLGKGGM